VAAPSVAARSHLERTCQIGAARPKYTALIRLPGRVEPARVTEDQTIQGFFVAAVAPGGALMTTPNRVLVLPVP